MHPVPNENFFTRLKEKFIPTKKDQGYLIKSSSWFLYKWA